MTARVICVQSTELGLACRNACLLTGGILAQYIHEDGRRGLRWVCGTCRDHSATMGLPQTLLHPWRVSVDELPVCQDNREKRSGANVVLNQSRCLVCREPYSEHHHWAPRAIFDPQGHGLWDFVVPLCKQHHDEWHDTMRQHGLRYPHELEAVA